MTHDSGRSVWPACRTIRRGSAVRHPGALAGNSLEEHDARSRPAPRYSLARLFGGLLTLALVIAAAIQPAQAQSNTLVLSTGSLQVTEGASSTFTVELSQAPTGSVTVSLASDNTDVSVSPSPLTFTTANWSTAQTVTVSAAADSDNLDDSAVVSLSASGGGYGSVSGSVAVAVLDTRPPAPPNLTAYGGRWAGGVALGCAAGDRPVASALQGGCRERWRLGAGVSDCSCWRAFEPHGFGFDQRHFIRFRGARGAHRRAEAGLGSAGDGGAGGSAGKSDDSSGEPVDCRERRRDVYGGAGHRTFSGRDGERDAGRCHGQCGCDGGQDLADVHCRQLFHGTDCHGERGARRRRR